MTDIVERLRFDAARCEATFSKGVASNIEEAMAEIERLRELLSDALIWLDPDTKNESRYMFRSNILAAIRAALGHQQQAQEPK